MSRLSIYETNWIDLVFENKNKEYGAYQLRQDSVKSAVTALFLGLLFVASLGGIVSTVNYFNPEPTIITTDLPDLGDKIIQVTNFDKPKNNQEKLPEIKSTAPEVPITKDVLINPIISKPSEANQDIATNDEIKNVTIETTEGTGIHGVNSSSDSGNGNGTETSKGIDYGTTIVNSTLLDKMPEFPGGINKFYSYVGNNFTKPEIEETKKMRIYVSFVIERDGSMTDIKVIKDPGYGLGKEAIRVLKSLKTKWSPGIINSKPVRTSYNLPITIEMN